MTMYDETSQILHKQNDLLLQKSVIKNNIQESTSQKYMHEVGAFRLIKGNRSNWENELISDEKYFSLGNPYFEFHLKSDNLIIDSGLENSHKVNHSLCKAVERRQVLPMRVNTCQSYFSPNKIGNIANFYEESVKIGEKSSQEDLLLKPAVENKTLKKRKQEEDSTISEECHAVKKNYLFKAEKAREDKSPYLEYIWKLENSNHNLCFNENSKGLQMNNITSKEEKEKGCTKDGVEIFGNRLTSSDRYKIKVICPHCTKKVPAPGFVRHLAYCMKGSIRRRKGL